MHRNNKGNADCSYVWGAYKLVDHKLDNLFLYIFLWFYRA